MPPHVMRQRKLRANLTLATFCLLVLFLLHRSFTNSVITSCPQSSLSDDVLLVIRTGATEALEKLPVHFTTTLSCVPHYVIYSDLEEDIQGHKIHNVLSGQMPQEETEDTPELVLYKQLESSGRVGLTYNTQYGSGPAGSVDNPGWKLDKWKFLPMVDSALKHKPDARWFVFMEPDTYLSWTNTLHYLSKFNSSQPYYLGKHMFVSNILFGHGGSGFAISKPAMEMAVHQWHDHREEYDQFTRKEWAGDMILGKTLRDAGVDMFWSFPHLQGDSLSTIDWNVTKLNREPWCYPHMTWHHMSRGELTQMWEFEQHWHRQHRNEPNRILQFRDIFNTLVYPHLRPELEAWDNLSAGTEYSESALAKLSDDAREALTPIKKNATTSFDACKAACESMPKCIQFSYAAEKCFISNELKLGHSADPACIEYSSAAGRCTKSKETRDNDNETWTTTPTRSGWLMDRVAHYVQELDQLCNTPEGNDWVT